MNGFWKDHTSTWISPLFSVVLQDEVYEVWGEAILGCFWLYRSCCSTQNTWELWGGKGWGWMELRAGVGEHGELETENPQ